MWNAIVSEDDTSQILSAWIAKEELRTLLSTVRVGGDPHLTRHRLHRFLAWCTVAAVANPGPHPGRESLPVSDPDELTPAERIDAARKIAAVCYFTGRGPPAVLSRNRRDMRVSKLRVGVTHSARQRPLVVCLTAYP